MTTYPDVVPTRLLALILICMLCCGCRSLDSTQSAQAPDGNEESLVLPVSVSPLVISLTPLVDVSFRASIGGEKQRLLDLSERDLATISRLIAEDAAEIGLGMFVENYVSSLQESIVDSINLEFAEDVVEDVIIYEVAWVEYYLDPD